MKKLKRIVAMALSVCMLFGYTATCYAGTLTVTCEKTYIYSHYSDNEEYGNLLVMQSRYYEKNRENGEESTACIVAKTSGVYNYVTSYRVSSNRCWYTGLWVTVFKNKNIAYEGYDRP